MTTINLEGISNNTKGMPDCWHIDSSGKSSAEVFQKRVGLPRSMRHDRRMVERFAVRANRLHSFVSSLLHYRNLGGPILTNGDMRASPEAIAMAEYDEGWHLRAQADLFEVAKLDEVTLKARLKDMLALRSSTDFKSTQAKVQALANRSNTTLDHAFETTCKCALETWLRARNDLANWAFLPEAGRQTLAEVLFAGFTMFGKRALEDVADIQPAVLDHYRSFLGKPATNGAHPQENRSNKRHEALVGQEQPVREHSDGNISTPTTIAEGIATAAATSAASLAATRGAIPSDLAAPTLTSLQQLYGLISILSTDAHSDPTVGIEPGLRIRALLDDHLSRLDDLRPRHSAKEVRELIERYCDAVLNMVRVLQFNESELSDLVPVLRAAWRMTVLSALKDGRPRAWFDMNVAERRELLDVAKCFEVEQARVTAATDQLAEIRKQLDNAKFTARTALKAQETQKNNEISSARQEQETIRMVAAQSLVPDGCSLDELMEDSSAAAEIEVDLESLNRQALLDMQSVVSSLVPAMAGAVRDRRSTQKATLGTSLGTQIDTTPVSPISAEQAAVETPTAPEVLSLCELDVSIAPDPTLSAAPTGACPPFIEPVATPPEPEPEPQEADLSVVTVDDALRHLHWNDSKEDAQKAFLIAHDQYQQIPSCIIDAIAQHWIVGGHLNVACQVLRDANESTLLADRVLDAALVRSAYFGMRFWPKDREALTYTQRNLNLLSQAEIEEQLNRRPAGKIIPYLLACATLQPALFAGGETQAPTLLKLAAPHFEDHLRQLISQTADFTMRGGRLDLDTLRNVKAQEVHKVATKLLGQVDSWVELNQNRTTGWHPLRMALRLSFKRPIIEGAINAIRTGEQGNVAAVRDFVNAYSTHVESRRLMDELVDELRADVQFADHIDAPAYNTFCQQMDALVSIAQEWLIEVVPSDVQAKDIQDFLRKFHTLLRQSVLALESHSEYSDLEHRAGYAMLLKLLSKLQSEIQQPTQEIWRFDQTEATFRLPEVLSHLEIGDAGVDLRLEWFASKLTLPNWLVPMVELATRKNVHWVRLLLLRQLEESGSTRNAEIDAVSNDIARERATLKKAIERYRNLSMQAQLSDMISETEHLNHVGRSNDWMEELSTRKPYMDISDITDAAKAALRSMETFLNSSAAELAEELDQELLSIRVKLGQDAVPEGWDVRAKQALERRSLSLVRELINQLKEHNERNTRVVGTTLLENSELVAFLGAHDEIQKLLSAHLNPREAGELVISERPGGFDYAIDKSSFKAVINTLLDWRSKGKNKRAQLEKMTYDGIVEVLEFLGINALYKEGKTEVLSGCEYSSTGDVRRLKVRIGRPFLPKGFPLFDGDIGTPTPLNVIFVQGDWILKALAEMIERDGLPDKAILLVGQPLSMEARNAFSMFCRARSCTIFLLDPVVLAYVATRHQQMRLETFLRVTTAWSFYNPYTKGDARLAAPPEMRFGREKDTASLVEPRGAALVYGGRQLGKTTLLHAAVQEFKKRDSRHNFAYYMPLDRKFQHAVERGIEVKKSLFSDMAQLLEISGVIPKNAQMDAEERLRQEFLKPGSTRVLFCLDEIDDVLNKDSASNFDLIRSLKALVNDPHNRFRVVLAGLNNVNRFRTYPNVPLEQLGSHLEVGILSSQDARSLILQPLTALGYRFEEPELVDRIMAFTNCHPSLLHIFCSALVEHLASDANRKDNHRLIRQADVENIENNSAVRKLSAERFDMTLNLDKRYTVAIYGLLHEYDKGIGKFTVAKALELARIWVPEEFESMSESSFENMLTELVGLGVLSVADKGKHLYALRNQSILQLIGSKKDIKHNLQVGIDELKNRKEDVLTCHAISPEPKLSPSPLSLQDEQTILQAKAADGAPKYSVSVIMGTEALGLTINAVQEGFNAINEFHQNYNNVKFDTRVLERAVLVDLRRFSETIVAATEIWTAHKPTVALVPLLGETSIDVAMDMISIANESASNATQLKNSLRIVFLLGPRLMWDWFAHSWITTLPEEIGGHVILDRWTKHACENLLEQQGMSATHEQGVLLREATEGWYGSLMKFIEARKRKKSAFNVADLDTIFTPLAALNASQFEKFVAMCGMNDLAWSMPLAGKLTELEMDLNFSKEDVHAAIEFMIEDDPDFALSTDMATVVVRWWGALRVIDVNAGDQRKAGKVTYRFTKGVQRAISEHQQRPAAKGTAA